MSMCTCDSPSPGKHSRWYCEKCTGYIQKKIDFCTCENPSFSWYLQRCKSCKKDKNFLADAHGNIEIEKESVGLNLCKKCQTNNPWSNKYCAHCGELIEPKVFHCGNCGGKYSAEDTSCKTCKSDLRVQKELLKIASESSNDRLFNSKSNLNGNVVAVALIAIALLLFLIISRPLTVSIKQECPYDPNKGLIARMLYCND